MINKDTIVAVVCLVSTVILYSTLGHIEEARAATFPMVVIVGMMGLSALLLIQSLLTGSGKKAGNEERYPWARFLLLLGMIVIYLAFMETVGFYLSAFTFFLAVCFILGRAELSGRRGLIWLASSAGFTAVLFLLFKVLLEVQTPRGLFY